MKTLAIFIGLALTQSALAQDSGPADRFDTLMTIQPAADVSYNESFASRRKAVAMRDDPKMSNSDKGRAAVSDFAQCLYDSDTGGARRVLSAQPGAPLRAAVTKFADGRCWLRGYVSFRPSAFQGALFKVAYRNEFRAKAPLLPEAPVDYAAIAAGAPVEAQGSFLAYRRFGECVVRRDPAASRALAMAPLASAAESAAFQTLGPSFSACIDAGANANFTKERLSGVVAEALYRLSVPGDAGK